jgi:hypothetical protein
MGVSCAGMSLVLFCGGKKAAHVLIKPSAGMLDVGTCLMC